MHNEAKMEKRTMTEVIIILVFVCVNTLLLGNSIYSQNEKLEQEIEKLEQEIKELKIMLKDRIVHVTHKIKE